MNVHQLLCQCRADFHSSGRGVDDLNDFLDVCMGWSFFIHSMVIFSDLFGCTQGMGFSWKDASVGTVAKASERLPTLAGQYA